MSVTIEIEPRTSGYSKQTLTVDDTTQASNYDSLRAKLGIQDKVETKVYVTNEDGSCVLLVPSGVKSGSQFYFTVGERSAVELEGAGDKWRQDSRGPPFEGIAEFGDKGTALENAAANGFLGLGQSTPLSILFPDANGGVRAAYQAGLQAQSPQSILTPADDTTTVAGLSHEPTLGELGRARSDLLRWAYNCGISVNLKPNEAVPSTLELREAYKRGKEAVCITISENDWSKVNIETFKLCSVPVEYALYEGGAGKKLASNKCYREALRTCFLNGVDDAWNARAANSVTQVTATLRVPETPSVREAFAMGQAAQKGLSSVAPGGLLVMSPENEIKLENIPDDAKYASTAAVFQEGLSNQWTSYSGAALPKVETRFPDTGAEERDAYNVGVAARREEEKRKEKERLAEEQENEEAPHEATFVETYLEPCVECVKLCHPANLVTSDPDGQTLCCGTTLGDWCIILLLFIFYYLYLAMWYWAFIEILMVVAEPQRPW
eukprot:TRINITY_DN1270_c8_g1_i1.p1 TRINITY_DN1270_c8_g1~~TRINITY_DN1270_c8_g1_i1.p1  ORF type:complete len:516 (+),score=133.48 TRINITY_DN1270_c8_g1_i1:68-1549(+)